MNVVTLNAHNKEPFDRGEAGVFTIAVADILDCIEQAVNNSSIAAPE